MFRPPGTVYGIDLGVGATDAGRGSWVTVAVPTGDGIRIEDCAPATEFLGAAPDRDATLGALRGFLRGLEGGAVGLDCPFGLPGDLAARLVGAVDWRTFLVEFPRQFAGPDDLADACTAWVRDHRDGSYLLRRSEAAVGAQCAYGFLGKHLTYHGIEGLLEPLGPDVTVLPVDLGSPVADGAPPPDRPFLLETYPAGALAARDLPAEGYKSAAPAARNRRARALDGLPVALPGSTRRTIVGDTGGDALDSVVAAVTAARATRTPAAARPDDVTREDWAIEGYVYT